ncbi:MAG: anaerobic ribonucleoside-triphosphate reductase activating protein [Bacilli bacterium]|nr:anaerobic ribonucleoside-triphosphate reductase activating protein [Bacilli bacterium]
MKIRLAAPLQPDSIVDGEGVRTVVWTQGCSHNCKGCHNPTTHDFKGGFEVDTKELIEEIIELEGQEGITFSGGDPMFQTEACIEIAKYAKENNLDIWCYTGFKFEDIVNIPKFREFLKYIDVLVDGKFIEEEKSLNLDFRGSRNQRIIDVEKSLKKGKAVVIPKYKNERVVDVKVFHPKHVYV